MRFSRSFAEIIFCNIRNLNVFHDTDSIDYFLALLIAIDFTVDS